MSAMDAKLRPASRSAAPIRPVSLTNLDCTYEERADGAIIARSVHRLAPHPSRLTERLEHWARVAPDRAYLARRDHGGEWRRISYADALAKVRALGAALLRRNLSPERPVAILSGNSLEHALLALASVHVGIPYTPVSVPYSLISTDFGKLRHIIGLTTPGLVFVQNGAEFARAIRAVVPDDVEVVCAEQPSNERPMTLFDELLETDPDGVDTAAAAVGPEHVAKILFTSGSTGVPKGVINTQGMWCANQQMIVQAFPFLAEEPPVLVDWTPWNHTFGGNHDFGLVLYNGGTLYIDDGKPVPGGVEESVRNLREIAPTFYLNVPKGFEEVLPYLRREPALRETFFSRVKLLFYAGAALAQHVMDAYDELAEATIGQRIQWMAGFGSTETAPFCLVNHADNVVAGAVGLPAASVELKLAPVADKLEARVRGPHITPGYWRAPDLTAAAFDDEGWYKFGDAMKWWDPTRRDLGFAFDGRITEDFKLATGTWVSVGPLRAMLIAHLAPYLKDAVIAGINRDFVSILIIPDVKACQSLCDFSDDPLGHPATHATFREMLEALAKTSTGSASRVMRALILREPLDIDFGEITDKGSINQRAVLTRRAALVEDLYAEPPPPHVIAIGLRT